MNVQIYTKTYICTDFREILPFSKRAKNREIMPFSRLKFSSKILKCQFTAKSADYSADFGEILSHFAKTQSLPVKILENEPCSHFTE